MGLWDVPLRLWTIARKVEDLLALHSKTMVALETIEIRLRALEDRAMRLERGEEQVVASAKAAAGVAAVGLASSVVADIVTRVTRIEMQQSDLQRRLPPSA